MEPEKTRDERIAELLEQQGADAVSAIKGPSLSDLTNTDAVVPPEDVEEEETPTGGKKVRIPASRLKTLTSKINELEAQLQQSQSYAERVAALEAQLQNKGTDDDLPDYWKAAWGDSDASRQAYKDNQRLMREEMQHILAQQEEARQAELAARAEQESQIEQSFDDQMDELEDSLGRELTDNQKYELMEIVEEYSPKDGDQYVAYIPIAKAYDIWSKTQGSTSKQEMARIAGAQSVGSTQTPSPERPQFGDWRRRFPGL